MNVDIANALFGYFETLYMLNQNLIKLCGIDVIDSYEYCHAEILRIIQDIPRLIPYGYNLKVKKLELNNRDGLLEYSNDLDYLFHDYEEILKENYNFLDKVRKIRNKYEHKMHGAKRQSSGSGSYSYFDFTFNIEGEKITIEAKEFIKLLNMLNNLFEKISSNVKKYAYDNDKTDYAYYRRLTRFSFNDFNKIYNSDLLRIFGRALSSF